MIKIWAQQYPAPLSCIILRSVSVIIDASGGPTGGPFGDQRTLLKKGSLDSPKTFIRASPCMNKWGSVLGDYHQHVAGAVTAISAGSRGLFTGEDQLCSQFHQQP